MNAPTNTPNPTNAIERARARLAQLAEEKQQRLQAEKDHLSANRLTAETLGAKTSAGIWRIDTSKDWNEEQRLAIVTGLERKSFCLIGAAGTGKTSTLKGLVTSLLLNNLLPAINGNYTTKHLHAGKPGIALVSFTNMAVRQIAKHFSRDITCCTIHKLLEFAPVYYEVDDPETGMPKKTMRFEPQRNKTNPLPRELKTIVIDESSMVDSALVELLIEALPDPWAVQFILLGDLNQLPPVYGGPILGRGLLSLPVVELTRVYRQALESPIISLAIDLKDGKTIPLTADGLEIDKGEHGKLVVKPWSKPISDEDACIKAANFIKGAISAGILDPYKDICLCPFNVGFGTVELNRSVADWLGRERNAFVYEIIAGFNTHYYAVGDKVLVNKREALITKIQRNPEYSGKRPANPDLYVFDRWGGVKKRQSLVEQQQQQSASENWEASNSDTDVDAILASLVSNHTEIEDRKASSSHRITVRFLNGTDPADWMFTDSEDTLGEDYETATLSSAGEVNEMLFGYVVTVHKSQGSEWRKVFIFLHNKHNQMVSRELLYTAVTRAAKELYLICEPDRGAKVGTLTKAAKSPRLKGNGLAEKLVSLKERFIKEAEEAIKKGGKNEDGEDLVSSVTPAWDLRFGIGYRTVGTPGAAA